MYKENGRNHPYLNSQLNLIFIVLLRNTESINMKAIFLTKNGGVETAFSVKETEQPSPKKDEVLVKIAAFGLNYADVLARKGLYGDAPPLPSILGYECVGRVESVGEDVTSVKLGQRVLAFTRFGSYAEYVTTNQLAVVALPENIDNGSAVALGTQYTTAYYAAYEAINLTKNDIVLVLSGAGGVGTGLIQLAKAKGCRVIAGIGDENKADYVKNLGANDVVVYGNNDLNEEIKKILGTRRVDVIFDPIGGSFFKKGLKSLNFGGKIVSFGAASRSGKGIIPLLKLLFGYGFFTPVKFLMKSQSLIGVNMLRIADHRKDILSQCLKNVVSLFEQEVITPHVGGVYKANEIATAHAFLESRKSKGKIVVEW
jgi:NADPH:quinone reductase-like Zn-dependent oxidoreductase